jgi:hypothetical protein
MGCFNTLSMTASLFDIIIIKFIASAFFLGTQSEPSISFYLSYKPLRW